MSATRKKLLVVITPDTSIETEGAEQTGQPLTVNSSATAEDQA